MITQEHIFILTCIALSVFVYIIYIHKGLMNLVETAKLISDNKKEMPSLNDATLEFNEASLEAALELAKKLGITIEMPDEEEIDE